MHYLILDIELKVDEDCSEFVIQISCFYVFDKLDMFSFLQ